MIPVAVVERAMKVQEVILRAISKRITWWQAAEIIGKCRSAYVQKLKREPATHSVAHVSCWSSVHSRWEIANVDGAVDLPTAIAFARSGAEAWRAEKIVPCETDHWTWTSTEAVLVWPASSSAVSV